MDRIDLFLQKVDLAAELFSDQEAFLVLLSEVCDLEIQCLQFIFNGIVLGFCRKELIVDVFELCVCDIDLILQFLKTPSGLLILYKIEIDIELF